MKPAEKLANLQHAVLALRHAMQDIEPREGISAENELKAWNGALRSLEHVEGHARAVRSVIRSRIRAIETRCVRCDRRSALRGKSHHEFDEEGGHTYKTVYSCRFCGEAVEAR